MCKVPTYEVNACETHVADVYAADIYTAEMHACPLTSKWSGSCSAAEIAAEVASLIHPGIKSCGLTNPTPFLRVVEKIDFNYILSIVAP